MTAKRRTIQATMAVTALAALLLAGGCSEYREANAMSDSDARQHYSGDETPSGGREVATFAAGCFWGVEAAFRQLEGVVATEVGYTGGHFENPTYEDVCSGTTGHAEAVRVKYDPNVISYEDLLEVFWRSHDPTQRNRQGPDVGAQYRSAIFYHGPEQRRRAEASKQRLDESGTWSRPVATEITEASTFWRAEEYHQQYLEKRGRATCHPSLQ